MPIQIIMSFTVRAEDGLALSSRNGYLTEEQRAIAPVLYRSLCHIAAAIENGDRFPPQGLAGPHTHIEAAVCA